MGRTGEVRGGLAFREITSGVISAAIEVHKELGPGLLESVYEACLAAELERAKLAYERQSELPVSYKGRLLQARYRIDFVVEDAIIVEVKSTERLLKVHEAQLLTYMRLAGKRVGLLMNFNAPTLREGLIRRIL